MATPTLEKAARTRAMRSPFSIFPDPPPLQNGDHLSVSEFERRYRAMPGLKKAELIEGIVLMPSPVGAAHAQAHMAINGLLFFYASATPGVSYGDSATLRLNAENEVQPDGMLRLESTAGGRSRLTRDGYYEGAPELVVEVANSTVAHDMHQKLQVYRKARVPEYFVWQLQEQRIDWFVLRSAKYVPLGGPQDQIRSHTFPGLWLDLGALIAGDMKKALAFLQRGIDSADHQSFVRTLAGK